MNNLELKLPEEWTKENDTFILTSTLGDNDENNQIDTTISGMKLFLNPEEVPEWIHFLYIDICDMHDGDRAIQFIRVENDEAKTLTYYYDNLPTDELKEMFNKIRQIAYSGYIVSMVNKKVFKEEDTIKCNLTLTALFTILHAEKFYCKINNLEEKIPDEVTLASDMIDGMYVTRKYDLE